MKKVVFICCAFAAMLFASCDVIDDLAGGYKGTNYIELTSSVNSMYDAEGSKIDVTVSITASLAEDLTLNFEVDGDEVALDPASVTVKAGEKEAGFAIKSVKALSADKTFTVTLDEEKTTLPEKVVWKEDFKVTVKASNPNSGNEGGGNEGGEEGGEDGGEDGGETPDPMAAVIEAYKTATGIDLSKYTGVVNATVVWEECDIESYEYLEPVTYTTQSVIALSEASTADLPVLKMTGNPMGIEDKIYERFRQVTVESEFWVGEYVGPDYAVLMEGIGWNAESEETFKMSLDGIKLAADKTVEFVAPTYSPYQEEEIDIVPFKYEFSAYERELETTLELTEGGDATANPEMHLNISPITEDSYELEGEGLWTEPTAELTEEGLTFTFCFDMANASDYIKVIVTYTPNE